MDPRPVKKMSLEEYFEFDRNSEEKWEYFDGTIFCMSGVSPNHSVLEVNLTIKIGPRAMEKGCQVFSSNLRVKAPTLPVYRYPDLSVSCGEPEYTTIAGLDCLTNPVLIVEILSKS